MVAFQIKHVHVPLGEQVTRYKPVLLCLQQVRHLAEPAITITFVAFDQFLITSYKILGGIFQTKIKSRKVN